MKTNIKYRKNNGQFASSQPLNIGFGIGWLILLAVLLVISAYMAATSNQKLISPLVDGIVEPVMAKEPEVRISCEDPIGYIRCKFYKKELTEQEAIMLISIGKAESGMNPLSKNRKSTARGLFQIIASTWYHYDCVGDKYNFKDNTNCAIKIMRQDGGFRAWDAYNRGMHKKFIKDIEI